MEKQARKSYDLLKFGSKWAKKEGKPGHSRKESSTSQGQRRSNEHLAQSKLSQWQAKRDGLTKQLQLVPVFQKDASDMAMLCMIEEQNQQTKQAMPQRGDNFNASLPVIDSQELVSKDQKHSQSLELIQSRHPSS